METINLLNGKEFCPSLSIMERLEEGAKSHSLIYTDNMRGIGKSFNLVEFARKYGHTVLVKTLSQVKIYRKEYNYENIDYYGDHLMGTCKKYVIDEGIVLDGSILDSDIITGFTNKQSVIVNKEDTYPGKVIESLRKDALKLSHRLRSNGLDSDYKMLITNLKSTMELVQYLEIRYGI